MDNLAHLINEFRKLPFDVTALSPEGREQGNAQVRIIVVSPDSRESVQPGQERNRRRNWQGIDVVGHPVRRVSALCPGFEPHAEPGRSLVQREQSPSLGPLMQLTPTLESRSHVLGISQPRSGPRW